jgi:hypothetical protein
MGTAIKAGQSAFQNFSPKGAAFSAAISAAISSFLKYIK